MKYLIRVCNYSIHLYLTTLVSKTKLMDIFFLYFVVHRIENNINTSHGL